MEERIKIRKLLHCASLKNSFLFQTCYNSLRRPIEKWRLYQIAYIALTEDFTDGIRILVKENGVGCLIYDRMENGFHLACKFGQIEIVKLILGINDGDKVHVVTVVNSMKQDGLSFAIESENEQLTRVLLSSELFNIDRIPCSSVSRLFDALYNGEKQKAYFLLQHGADVTFIGHQTELAPINCTCLSAIRVPSLLCEVLLRGGDANDVHKGTPLLHLAINAKADRNTVRMIVESGADISQRDRLGRAIFSCLKSLDQLYGFIDANITVKEIEQHFEFSTLELVLHSSHKSEDVKFFLENGADVNFNKCGEEALLIRAVRIIYLKGDDVVNLIKYGADPFEKDKEGNTVLQLMCGDRKGLFEDIYYLLELGIKPDGCLFKVMDNIYSPEKKTQLIKRLLEYGADPNEVSYKRRQSILTSAIERNMYDITKELINHGADINYIDNNRKSPLESTIQLATKDEEFLNLKTLLKCPVGLCTIDLLNEVEALPFRFTPITANCTSRVHYNHHHLFDLTGVFYLLVAGADLVHNKYSGFNLNCLLKFGLFETSLRFLNSGLNCKLESTDLEKNRTLNFKCKGGFCTARLSEDEIFNLVNLSKLMETEPQSLQHLCRSRIRQELAICGHSIIPLIDQLPIPPKIKNYLKFEDIPIPLKEIVSVDFVNRDIEIQTRRKGRWFYNDDDDGDYDDDEFTGDDYWLDYDNWVDEYCMDVDSDIDEHFLYDEADEFESTCRSLNTKRKKKTPHDI